MIRRPPRSTLSSSSAASDVYKRQLFENHTNNDSIQSFEASPLIMQEQYIRFLDLTGWRKNIGWGDSPTRCTSIGTLAIKDLNMSSFEWGRPVLGDKIKILGNVSWYDAWLFSKAYGGRLPYEAELKVLKSPAQNYNEYQKEWCADWYDQEMGLMKVAEWTGYGSNTARVNFGGANPDVRDKSIGFRIIKEQS